MRLWVVPCFYGVVVTLARGAQERRLVGLFFYGDKVAKIFSAMSAVEQMCCFGLEHGTESKFSVKRNLLEKAFACPRGNFSAEQGTSQL